MRELPYCQMLKEAAEKKVSMNGTEENSQE